MQEFLEMLQDVQDVLSESRLLQTVQREINPLKAKGDNPIKKLVRDFRKAKRTRKSDDVARARSAHRVGLMWAQQHGYPRLEKQIKQHERKVPKPKKLKKKRGLRTSSRTP